MAQLQNQVKLLMDQVSAKKAELDQMWMVEQRINEQLTDGDNPPTATKSKMPDVIPGFKESMDGTCEYHLYFFSLLSPSHHFPLSPHPYTIYLGCPSIPITMIGVVLCPLSVTCYQHLQTWREPICYFSWDGTGTIFVFTHSTIYLLGICPYDLCPPLHSMPISSHADRKLMIYCPFSPHIIQ